MNCESALRRSGVRRVATITLLLVTAAGAEQKSADEIAQELSNPTNALGSLANNVDFQAFGGDLPGADRENSFTYLFQPSIPFPQSNGYNLLLRPAIPVPLQVPVSDGAGGFRNEGPELGNISFDLAFGKTFDSGVLALVGAIGELPTNTNDAVGPDQWRLGPEFAVGLIKKWGVVGALVTHKWDVAGDEEPETSITSGQYFYAFSLGNGWQIASGPTYSYDHNGESGNKLTFPIGVGLAKTSITVQGTPVKFQLQYWHFVESPEPFSPAWQIRFNVTPVIELPWGG